MTARGRGRPPKYGPELHKQIIANLRLGCSAPPELDINRITPRIFAVPTFSADAEKSLVNVRPPLKSILNDTRIGFTLSTEPMSQERRDRSHLRPARTGPDFGARYLRWLRQVGRPWNARSHSVPIRDSRR